MDGRGASGVGRAASRRISRGPWGREDGETELAGAALGNEEDGEGVEVEGESERKRGRKKSERERERRREEAVRVKVDGDREGKEGVEEGRLCGSNEEREREGHIGVLGEKGRGVYRPRLQKPRVSNAEWTLFVREMTHCVHRAARGPEAHRERCRRGDADVCTPRQVARGNVCTRCITLVFESYAE